MRCVSCQGPSHLLHGSQIVKKTCVRQVTSSVRQVVPPDILKRCSAHVASIRHVRTLQPRWRVAREDSRLSVRRRPVKNAPPARGGWGWQGAWLGARSGDAAGRFVFRAARLRDLKMTAAHLRCRTSRVSLASGDCAESAPRACGQEGER